MSRQSVFKRWMPVIALVLLPLLHSVGVRAAPAAAPVLGFTVTPTFTSTPTLTPTPTHTPTPQKFVCDPIVSKRVDPPMAESGGLVTFTISVKNLGQLATVNGQVQDIVPDYLEVLGVDTLGEHHGQEIHWKSGQTVIVDTGILGQNAEVTILIHTQAGSIENLLGDGGPSSTARGASALVPICVQNVAYFTADNCPDRRAEAEPCLLPTTGNTDIWWMLAAGLATSVLVLSLALSKRGR